MNVKQLLRTVALVLPALLSAGMTLLSAKPIDQQEYSLRLSFTNAPLKQVLDEFTGQTGVSFSYNTSMETINMASVNVDLENATLETLMEHVFAGSGITWKVLDQVVALYAPEDSGTGQEEVPEEDNGRRTLSGHVDDASGAPVIGVTVMVEGTLNGTQTDPDGNWSLTVEDASDISLVFSCIGYRTVTMPVGINDVINIVMQEDAELLEEVVVVGYGTQRKANITGSVTSIDFGSIAEGRPIVNTSAALAGLAP